MSELSFGQDWSAEVLTSAPLIAPARQFVYPLSVPGEEEAMARGAMYIRVRASSGGEFLAMCALGFTDPSLPRGVFACPNPREMCAVAGGYAYLVDTSAPEKCVFLPMRPVVEVQALVPQGMLLFRGFHTLMAWGANGRLWETGKLTWEGLRLTEVDSESVRGFGWDMRTDKEVEFAVDLRTGKHSGGGFQD